MKKIKFILIITTLVMFSCNDNYFEQNNTSSNQDKIKNRYKIRGDNSYDVLGFGCDVTGEYLDQDKSLYPVLDVASLLADGYIVYDYPTNTEVVIHGGTNLKTLSNKLSEKIAVSASIPIQGVVFTGGFSSEKIGINSITTKYSYAYVDVNCYSYHCAIKPFVDNSILINYLSSEFENDLLTLNSNQIVTKYGTHVYTDIYTGGQLHCKYKTCITEENNEQTVSSGANAGIKDICNLSSNTSYTKSVTAKLQEEFMECKTVGGEHRTPFTWTPGSGVTFNIDSWSQTVKESNPHSLQLIDIANNSLVAIYEFVQDPVKKADLKTAVDNYISSKAINLIPVVPLYRYCSKSTTNHFYTIDENELGFSNRYWTYEGIAAFVSTTQQANMSPFYRYCKSNQIFLGPNYIDHYYTRIINSGSGYTYEGIECYVYPTQVEGTVPLGQYFNSSKHDHFYCVNPTAENLSGYSYNWDCCYVYPGTR